MEGRAQHRAATHEGRMQLSVESSYGCKKSAGGGKQKEMQTITHLVLGNCR